MEPELREFLIGLYKHIRFQQEMLCELSIAIRAQIEVQKQNPELWKKYERAHQVASSDATAQAHTFAIQGIDLMIRKLGG